MIHFLTYSWVLQLQPNPVGVNISGDDFNLFKEFLGTKFEDLNLMNLKNNSRVKILNHIIDYYSLHLQMFKTPKSINVFNEIFK